MLKHILTFLAIVSIVGCSARPIREVQHVGDGYILAARTKSVEVHAQRMDPFQAKRDLWIDVWNLRLVNNDKKKDWCASVEWRHMDYDIQVPNVWFYLPSYSYTDIGHAVQSSWKYDDMQFTLDDAAFSVFRLNFLKPKNGQCVVKAK